MMLLLIMSTTPRIFITPEDVSGHKILKCYNRKTWKWYTAKTKLIVLANSTIVHPKRYYYDRDIEKMYEIPNDDLRTNKIKITHIEKENKNDKCIPLYYGLMHNNKIEYEEGKTYETLVDTNVEKEASYGFYFKLTEEALEESMDSANHQVLDSNSKNIFSKVRHHFFS
jgi:hypothetical protein